MNRKFFLAFLPAMVFMATPIVAAAQTEAPINIRVKSPDRLGDTGVLLSGDWQLILEFEVVGAVGVVDQSFIPNSTTNMALILRDEDDCIHMQDWFAPGDPSFAIEGCAGARNETFVRFAPDMFDKIGVAELGGLDGIDAFQTLLQDDAYEVSEIANLDRQYFVSSSTGTPSKFVGAITESTTAPLDGYGYGVNDDFPGLYIWAEIGTGIVTDVNFNPVADPETGAFKLRNMAGLVNSISYTQLAKDDKTSLVAVMNVERGVLEPIIQFDFINVSTVDGTSSTGFLKRLDGGPVETVLFPDTTPRGQTDAFTELFSSLEPYEVVVRAAVVEGDAKPFIQDLDGNGKFNRKDILLAGHTLLSDVQRFKVRAIQYEALDTGLGFECPATNIFKEVELDSDPDFGIGCSTGSARSVVRPPR
jgi:hypothetical protein